MEESDILAVARMTSFIKQVFAGRNPQLASIFPGDFVAYLVCLFSVLARTLTDDGAERAHRFSSSVLRAFLHISCNALWNDTRSRLLAAAVRSRSRFHGAVNWELRTSSTVVLSAYTWRPKDNGRFACACTRAQI